MNIMKRYTCILLLCCMFLVFVLVYTGCSNDFKPSPTSEPTGHVTLESATSENIVSEHATPEHTEEILEVTGTILSTDEAEVILNEKFEEDYKISYLPDINKYEEGILHYGFLLDYSDWESNIENAFVYVWINSATGETNSIMEKELYANIPDPMFPVPMLNGTVIPYDYYSPPGYAWSGGYVFSDKSVMEMYQAQLREAGFVEYGEAMSVDSLWLYERDTDGATLMVEFFYGDEGSFSICMSVSFRDR
jgi:hypothetical protein